MRTMKLKATKWAAEGAEQKGKDSLSQCCILMASGGKHFNLIANNNNNHH